MAELGLFPLGIVLLPGEHVPLHIFEERYKELIGECLDTSGEFGLLLADDRGVGIDHRFHDLAHGPDGRAGSNLLRGRSSRRAQIEE